MTAPRQVLRGRTYLITRRCLLRHFFLRPSQEVNAIVAYVLAVSAQRYGVEVHAFCVLSNHLHLVVTDPDARLPRFQQYLAAFIARAVNALLGRTETYWAPGSYSAVALGGPDDVLAKAAYTLANPVAAGLVPAGHLWQGLWSSPSSIGTTIKVKRPARFFDADGDLPDEVDLQLQVPAGFDSPQDFREQLQAELSRLEQVARETHGAFLGAEGVRAQDPFDRPASEAAKSSIRPRVAAKDKWKRIELLQRLKEFVEGYRKALAVWREGKVSPVFPAGTYLMRVLHGCSCVAA